MLSRSSALNPIIMARTRYVPAGTLVIVYDPSASVIAPMVVPTSITLAYAIGVPSAFNTFPRMVPPPDVATAIQSPSARMALRITSLLVFELRVLRGDLYAAVGCRAAGSLYGISGVAAQLSSA